jgi:hypothetical protein
MYKKETFIFHVANLLENMDSHYKFALADICAGQWCYGISLALVDIFKTIVSSLQFGE